MVLYLATIFVINGCPCKNAGRNCDLVIRNEDRGCLPFGQKKKRIFFKFTLLDFLLQMSTLHKWLLFRIPTALKGRRLRESWIVYHKSTPHNMQLKRT